VTRNILGFMMENVTDWSLQLLLI